MFKYFELFELDDREEINNTCIWKLWKMFIPLLDQKSKQ